MILKNKEILILTSCSAKKKKTPERMKANDLYNGDLFNLVKKFAKRNNFTFRIISAKYGLISPDEDIEYYNKTIENNEDIQQLQELVNPKLNKLLNNYDKILLIMGEDYKKILDPLKNDKFIYFFDKRGLGGYLSLMTQLLKLEEKILYKLIFENKIITIETIKNLSNNIKDF